MVLLNNDSGTQTLTAPDSTAVRWDRSGAVPQVSMVSFAFSSDMGETWNSLGSGTRIAGGWQLTGVSLSSTGLLRAQGRVSGGLSNGSSGIIQQVGSFSVTPLPEIAIEQPVGTNISDGGNVWMGSDVVGTDIPTIFTLRNLGYADLTGLGITIDGTNSDDFTVTASPTSPLSGVSSTSFTVQFKPRALGARTAVLHIASNDSDENPFDINLTGLGVANVYPSSFQPLVQAEYFVGADPGQGNGTPLALAGSAGLARDLADITIPVGDLPPGTHNVGVRVRDEAGRWSNPLIRRFTMSTFTLAGGVDPANPDAGNLFPKTHQPLVQAE
jgi:hypothetical protein